MVNSLDVVIVMLILTGAYLGLSRGILGEFFALVGVCVGILMASHFCQMAQTALQPIFREPSLSLFIGYLTLLFVGMLTFFLVRMVLKPATAEKAPGGGERLLAALLGGVKSILLVAVVVFLIIFIWGPDNGFTSGSQLLARYLVWCRPAVGLMPEEMRSPLEEYLDGLPASTAPEKEAAE